MKHEPEPHRQWPIPLPVKLRPVSDPRYPNLHEDTMESLCAIDAEHERAQQAAKLAEQQRLVAGRQNRLRRLDPNGWASLEDHEQHDEAILRAAIAHILANP